MSFCEGVSHTAAEDELIYFAQQVLDDTDLRADLRAAHDGDERTLDVRQNVIHSLHLFLHEETEHAVVLIEIVCYNGC